MNAYPDDTDLIQRLVAYAGMKPAVLAKYAGVAVSTVNRPFNGTAQNRLGRSALEKLQAAFPDFPGWPASPLGDRRLPFHGAEPERDPDHVMVQEFDLDYGMGGGTYLDFPVKAEPVSFSRAWLRHFTKSPVDALFFARGMGDSMMPTIADADIVLIDTAQQTPRMGDQIWAIDFGGVGMIKRLRPMPDGGVKIQSDNPSIRDEVAHDGEMNVIGRVVAIVRKV